MVGVILAAGDGTRLMTSTGQDICKALRKINDSYLIEYALSNLIDLDVTEVYIVVGKQGELIKNAIGYEYKGLNVNYIHQPQQKGLVDAFVQSLKVMDCDETVILQLADEIFVNLQTKTIKNVLETADFDFFCGVTTEENPEKIKNNFSVETDNDSLLIKCIEKPQIVTNNIKGTGFSIYNSKTQKVIKETYETTPHKVRDICECFNYLTEMGCRGLAFFVAEKEFNINTASDLTEAERFLKR